MNRIYLALWALLMLGSCQEELPIKGPPENGRDWIEASAIYHDPQGLWPAFRGQIIQRTHLPDGAFGWENRLWMDLRQDSFRREGSWKGSPVIQRLQGQTICHVDWQNAQATASDSLRLGFGTDSCGAIGFYRDFYGFLVGLPMSALLGEGVFNDMGTNSMATPPQRRIEADFGPSQPIWTFIIDERDYRLLEAGFRYSNGSGEQIVLDQVVNFQQMKLAETWDWRSQGGRAIVFDSLRYLPL